MPRSGQARLWTLPLSATLCGREQGLDAFVSFLARGHVPPCSFPDAHQKNQLDIPSLLIDHLSLVYSSMPIPATGTTPALLLWAARCHEAIRQCRAGQLLLFLCSHFLSWVCVALLQEGRMYFPPAPRACPGHRPHAHLQIPSAKCCF